MKKCLEVEKTRLRCYLGELVYGGEFAYWVTACLNTREDAPMPKLSMGAYKEYEEARRYYTKKYCSKKGERK